MNEDSDDTKEKKHTPVGVSVIVPEHVTESLAEVAIDVFKPLSQGLGMLGDWVESKRREKNAIRLLKQAKEIAINDGKEIEQPTAKFLIPYLNAASLEDETDAAIQEKWANLLVNAGAKPDGIAYFARSLLQEISSDEVTLLDALVQKTKALEFSTYDDYTKSQFDERQKLISGLESLIPRLNAGEFDSALKAQKAVGSEADKIESVLPISFSLQTTCEHLRRDSMGYANLAYPQWRDSWHIYLMLESRNVMDEAEAHSPYGTKGFVNVVFLELTKLGFELAKKIYRPVSIKPEG